MFPLTPHTFTEAFWRGHQRRFALALNENYLYFWDPDSAEYQSEPKDWVFAVEGTIPIPKYATLNANFLVSVFQASLQDRKVGRVLRWDDKYVYLRPNGVGSISQDPRRGGRFDITTFHFDGGGEVFMRKASDWLERIQMWAQEPKNDFAFALHWGEQNAEQQAQQLVQFCMGDWDELRRVAEWILMLEAHDHYNPNLNIQDTVVLQLGYFDGLFAFWLGMGEDKFSTEAAPTKRAPLWNQWLRFFNLVLDYEILENHMAASRAADMGFAWDYFCLCLHLTRHEYLETLMQLRDWLRDRVGLADERIAELLS